ILKDGNPHNEDIKLEQLFSIASTYFKIASFNLDNMEKSERSEGQRAFGLQSFLMSLTALEAFTNTYFHLRSHELKNDEILKRIDQNHGSISRKIVDLIEMTQDGPLKDQVRIMSKIFELSQLRNELVHPRWRPSTLMLEGPP